MKSFTLKKFLTLSYLRTSIIILSSMLFVISANAFTIPAETKQIILGIADTWHSSTATLQYFEQHKDGKWHAVSNTFPARIGREGLAWGRGISPVPDHAVSKKESDWKSPCGVFELGAAYGYAPEIEKQPDQLYYQVVAGDLWVDDSTSPQYNQFIQLGRPVKSSWEHKQQMRTNDPAHSIQLFIAHNAVPNVQPGAGSAIFFHIWRDNGGKPSSGCTVFAENNLRKMIAWVDPDKKPLYVLLPKEIYNQVKTEWRLP